MNLTSLTSADLAKITTLLKDKESLLAKVAVIDKSLATFESGGVVKRGYKISAAGKKRIAAAQKARWAKIRAKKAAKPVAKAKISAARKEYYAKIKAEKAKKK